MQQNLLVCTSTGGPWLLWCPGPKKGSQQSKIIFDYYYPENRNPDYWGITAMDGIFHVIVNSR